MVLASVLALGAASVVYGASPANASPSGTSGTLTVSDGTSTIRFAGGATLSSPDLTVSDAAWSPDGSRAMFVTANDEIATIRYGHGNSEFWTQDAEPGEDRHEPTWRGDGAGIVFAAKHVGEPWRLEAQPSAWVSQTRVFSPADGMNYLHPDGGPGTKLVYQVQPDDGQGNPTGQAAVGLYEDDVFKTVIDDGRNPAISPDGGKIAFVRSDGVYDQIWVNDISGGTVTQVTANAVQHDNPTWSPIGDTIAFEQGTAVATVPAGGIKVADPTVVSGLTGAPSYQPRRRDRVARLAGSDRHATAAAVSQSHWATVGDTLDKRQPAEAVVLSRSDTFADALSGSALAAAKQGPLLMTPPGSLNSSTKAEIQRILAPGKTVYLLGSTGALSKTVEDQIKALGYTTVRLAGSDRFSTSVAIANAIDPAPDLVLAATGRNFPDALAAGAAAGSYDVPGYNTSAVVVLTDESTLPAPTKNYLDALTNGPAIFGIGGQAATATAAYGSEPVYGANRFETALYTAWTFFGGSYYAGVATGYNWPDALAGGALMATLNGPLMLTQGSASEVAPETAMLLDEQCGSIHTGLIFGGSGVVATAQEGSIGGWISGPGSYSVASNPGDVGLGAGTASIGTLSASATGASTHRSPAELTAAAKSVQERFVR